METYLAPLWISLKTVVVATAITFFLGIAAARWMAHYTGRFKSVIDGLFILPLVLPPVVTAESLTTYTDLAVPVEAILSTMISFSGVTGTSVGPQQGESTCC